MERYDLPDGWEWKTVGDVVKVNYGDSLQKQKRRGGDIVVYGSNGEIGRHDEAITRGATIVIGRKGSAGEVHFSEKPCWAIDTTYFIDEFPSELDIKFFYHFLKNQNLGDLDRSTAIPGLNRNDLYAVDFPLPPLPEQQRIVAKIESLFEQSRTARTALTRVPVLMAQFRRAVLASATLGRLTEDWREKNPTIERASDLLQRILVRRLELAQRKTERTHIEELLKRFSTDEFYSEDLPESWAHTIIDNIGTVCNGSTPSRKIPNYWDGNIPWVSSGEVQNCIIQETREKITQEGYDNSSVRILPKGTVLLAMIGEGKTRGQSAILEIEACINQNMAAIVLDHNLIESKYLWYWFQSVYDANRDVGSGSGPQALNCQRVRDLPFILPPLEEQVEIVQRVEKMFAQADIIEQAASVSLRRAEQVDQSILARAFRGELR